MKKRLLWSLMTVTKSSRGHPKSQEEQDRLLCQCLISLCPLMVCFGIRGIQEGVTSEVLVHGKGDKRVKDRGGKIGRAIGGEGVEGREERG